MTHTSPHTGTSSIPNVLTIAGSDPSGGAGIQADLKTFSALGTYATSVITALTAQNTQGVRGVHPVPAAFIATQLETLLDDVRLDAVKIGMVASREVADVIADLLTRRRPRWIVLDPVMVAKSGDVLVDDAGIRAVREILVPLADLITPNLPEAAVLLDKPTPRSRAEMMAMVPALRDLGAGGVLLKGGHLDDAQCPDLLIRAPTADWLEGPRIDTRNLHGTGCSLSSAITARLARGDDLPTAVATAKAWLADALSASHRLDVGQGHGPVHHFHAWW
ncbi:bifunctional hydroxymethylpyrimidine kinase/phosphomethylpyrimidine kinase [Halomonas urumqiensis]|uniref:hydroxymethylpyrimidine kinase n=1 Tax=Halomonas urumqiensis TaxID=1684789 RepID=A0A2N7UP16_9GAMM|nr:bifunctional hydroxymethylpyrimidine kinase/phosphomethylpyrimidine kinase [Halomonas urumqiensis]PMR82132.1 bifunctional hydroxymethylpyrimidine kinase/phosphomethylpyrimidine kinase [Halomonas urumqiensis]PTB02537.1 bifunctional hydroxymethylpyrimidine kinase/phosphomethylpyrimidine kinase [Halomonas urumqiensis]GHE21011.1 hydroxymethylpyrimidine/phosphomethylpyrimidine kinase [Halomonas urumqiensis]